MYQHIDATLIRASVTPLATPVPAWPGDGADLEQVRTWIEEIWADASLSGPISHASPLLAHAVQELVSGRVAKPSRLRRISRSLARYLLRMRHRATPFGLFAGPMTAFGGPAGLPLAHDLFHSDSKGVLDHARAAEENPSDVLGAKETSLLAMSLLKRAAQLELGEQGDVWSRVEDRRPLPDDITPQQVGTMAPSMRRLLLTDARPLLRSGPLAPVRTWIEDLEHHGHRLAAAAEADDLSTGRRAILARHILFHWNRMGFGLRQQAIWARAAREAAIGTG
ncbi:thiopeptide-type bacteriocin biosynthesis protein [Streptomyces sp. NPDC057552]|uniref:thiopeptide-type bacteriocin biosynthesis protein n=1 Tax=Streptomyces sp. NPDC057552 TaxID=3350537 RepID=UPI0036C3A804